MELKTTSNAYDIAQDDFAVVRNTTGDDHCVQDPKNLTIPGWSIQDQIKCTFPVSFWIHSLISRGASQIDSIDPLSHTHYPISYYVPKSPANSPRCPRSPAQSMTNETNSLSHFWTFCDENKAGWSSFMVIWSWKIGPKRACRKDFRTRKRVLRSIRFGRWQKKSL